MPLLCLETIYFGIRTIVVSACSQSTIDQSRLSWLWLHAGKQLVGEQRGGAYWLVISLTFRQLDN